MGCSWGLCREAVVRCEAAGGRPVPVEGGVEIRLDFGVGAKGEAGLLVEDDEAAWC